MDEGLEVEIDWKTFRGTQAVWKMGYLERPQDKAVDEGRNSGCMPLGYD